MLWNRPKNTRREEVQLTHQWASPQETLIDTKNAVFITPEAFYGTPAARLAMPPIVASVNVPTISNTALSSSVVLLGKRGGAVNSNLLCEGSDACFAIDI